MEDNDEKKKGNGVNFCVMERKKINKGLKAERDRLGMFRAN